MSTLLFDKMATLLSLPLDLGDGRVAELGKRKHLSGCGQYPNQLDPAHQGPWNEGLGRPMYGVEELRGGSF